MSICGNVDVNEKLGKSLEITSKVFAAMSFKVKFDRSGPMLHVRLVSVDRCDELFV
jgi:hypothetical protein